MGIVCDASDGKTRIVNCSGEKENRRVVGQVEGGGEEGKGWEREGASFEIGVARRLSLSARLHRERTAGMRMNRLRDDPLPREGAPSVSANRIRD